LFGHVLLPPDFRPGVAYPVIVHAYGGPQYQLVTSAFAYPRYRLQPMVVVCVDGRGTPHRGLRFESAIRDRLGQLEVDDIDVCEDAMARRRFVDRTRIAIHGWSFGGYVTLRALATRPEWFSVAIACAPVVRWDWYSAAYVERYLGVLPLPEDSHTGVCSPEAERIQAAYANASITSVVDLLPKEPNRLLLVHGWGDDNVHVAHSAELVRKLQRLHAHFPVRLAVYANERHGLRQPASNEHFETLLAFWLFHSL
ncbi:alpha/beta-hydrolase, partial [Coemansia reversa NRRL 1564]